MPRHSVFAKALADQKWQILGFGLTLTVMAALVVYIWPAYRDTLVNLELPEALQALLGSDLSIATAPGFLNAEFFSWIPVLLIVYAVIQGTGAIAGEESSGTIDLLMAQPISRTRMVLEKCASVAVGTALILAFGFAGFAISVPFVDIDVTLADCAVAVANMLPITLLFFALSLWLGAVAPNRAQASGAVVGVATAAYFANTIARTVDALSWARYASPFYYYGGGQPLVSGIDWAHAAMLLGSAVLFVVLALRAFERRDISIGGATGLRFADVVRRAVG